MPKSRVQNYRILALIVAFDKSVKITCNMKL